MLGLRIAQMALALPSSLLVSSLVVVEAPQYDVP